MTTKNDWTCHPMNNAAPFAVDITFTEAEFLQLLQGYTPQDMDDRWFVYVEDGWLHMHRSWTGYEIFKAQLMTDMSGKHCIRQVWVEQNPEKFTAGQNSSTLELFVHLVKSLSSNKR